MLTIGQVSKMANLSPRTIRHYESLKLISSVHRGENNYRYYTPDVISGLERIRELQSFGFSLEEIREILPVKLETVASQLRGKLRETDQELCLLTARRQRIEHLLSVLSTEGHQGSLTSEERNVIMETVRDSVVAGLKGKLELDRFYLEVLGREMALYESEVHRKFFDALGACLEFARSRSLRIGPGRGSASSSLLMFGLGLTEVDPVAESLIPERLSMLPLEIHIDVEFARGQEFVDYCRKVSDGLSWGNIHAFKMPLIDIISRVVKEVGLTWDCLRIPDDDRRVLELIGQGDIEKVFLLDYSPNALIMKFEEWAPDFVGNEKLKEYLQAQNIHSLRDLQNIMALWHPTSPAKIARIDRYKQAKSKPHKYEFLDAVQQAVLEPNFGLIIYHEDIIKLIELATGWDPVRCAIVRREMFLMTDHVDIQKFKETVDPEMAALILAEAPHTFCKSHIHSHGRFTEATAYLKAYHRDSYLSAVAQWEQEHGLMYDDIGVRLRNVSLLQN